MTTINQYLANVSAGRRAKRLGKPGTITLQELLTKWDKQTRQESKKSQAEIRDFLKKMGKAWRQNNMAKRGYVKTVEGDGEGISDVVGFCSFEHQEYKLRICVPVFVEVKNGDKLRPKQVEFLTNAHEAGCIAMVACSLEECKEKFRKRFYDLFEIEPPFAWI